MKFWRLIFLMMVAILMAFPLQAKTHQVTLSMWRQSPRSTLRSLNIYYHSGLQKFVYFYVLTDGTSGTVEVEDVVFSRESALYAYRVYYNFINPVNDSSIFMVYIYPSSATGDVPANIAKNAASAAVGNNVLQCLRDLQEKKNRRVQFYQISTKTTIDCRYY